MNGQKTDAKLVPGLIVRNVYERSRMGVGKVMEISDGVAVVVFLHWWPPVKIPVENLEVMDANRVLVEVVEETEG